LSTPFGSGDVRKKKQQRAETWSRPEAIDAIKTIGCRSIHPLPLVSLVGPCGCLPKKNLGSVCLVGPITQIPTARSPLSSNSPPPPRPRQPTGLAIAAACGRESGIYRGGLTIVPACPPPPRKRDGRARHGQRNGGYQSDDGCQEGIGGRMRRQKEAHRRAAEGVRRGRRKRRRTRGTTARQGGGGYSIPPPVK